MGDNCATWVFKVCNAVLYIITVLYCPVHLHCRRRQMDIQKIIHNALYEFIQSYIPDADLR